MTVEIYDFRKPSRLSGDLEQRLGGWLRSICRLIPDHWARHMPFRVEMELQRLEALTAQEALVHLPDALIGYRMVRGAEPAEAFLLLPRPLVLALVAAMVGAAASSLPEDRELTVVEDSLCDYLVQHLMLPVFQETWPGREGLALTVRQKESNPKYARVFAPDALVVVGTFAVRGPFGEQAWYWIEPQKRLLELFAELRQEGPGAAQQVAGRQRMEELVRQLPVEIAVTLGKAELPLLSLARLHAGDLIILNQRVSEPLAASVAGEKKLRVWPGRVGSRQAVQIESLLGEG
jgi:flagellar motor switch protein FliM